jgi:Uma2 family endonuclease
METRVAQDKQWTYQRMVEKLPEESRFEIINGKLYDMSPTPNSQHQRISRELEFLLITFVKNSKLGEVFHAPMDVILDKHNVVQPDILFIANNNSNIITKKCIEGTPDLVVEIISPSSYYRDQVEKKELYEKFGVKEYWIIDPANKVIEIFTLKETKYILHAFIAEEGKVASALLQGFEVNIHDIINQ